METFSMEQSSKKEITQEYVDKFWSAFKQLSEQEIKGLMYVHMFWSGNPDEKLFDDEMIRNAENKLEQAGFDIDELADISKFRSKKETV